MPKARAKKLSFEIINVWLGRRNAASPLAEMKAWPVEIYRNVSSRKVYCGGNATDSSASIASTSSLLKPGSVSISEVCSPIRGALVRLISWLAMGGVPGICAMAMVLTPGYLDARNNR